MSARLNRKPIGYASWKGKTIHQIASQIQKNKNNGLTSTVKSNRLLFVSPPNKIYRRELATNSAHLSNCGTRHSSSIEELNMPNGYIVSDTTQSNVGLVDTFDLQNPNNTYENGSCSNASVCLIKTALSRVRSSGMIKRKYNSAKNNDPVYFTNTNQYLVSRNRTFLQNQYRHVRQGAASLINSPSLYKTNVYSPNGLSHCKMSTIIAGVNDTFYYTWTDFLTSNLSAVATTPDSPSNNTNLKRYKVVIPPGNYDVDALNSVFKSVMMTNGHYYMTNRNKSLVFLLNIIYNTILQKVEIQIFSNSTVRDANQYILPNGNPTGITTPYITPAFYFPSAAVGVGSAGSVFGFQPGFYPSIDTAGTNQSSATVGIASNRSFTAHPLYDIMYYKPSNTRFGVQGGVSSSDRITRVNYDTITRNGLSYQVPFGTAVANALAYGVPGTIYTLKDKYGYPNNRTPVFCNGANNIKCSKDNAHMYNG